MPSVQQFLFAYAEKAGIRFSESDLDKPLGETDIDSMDAIGFIAACEKEYGVEFAAPMPNLAEATPRSLIALVEQFVRERA